MSELRERFFVTRDGEWEGLPRDYVDHLIVPYSLVVNEARE